jgi:hypothetical protein
MAGVGAGGAAQAHTHLTVADMPMTSNGKGAPRKFKGDYNKVDPFFEEYELLLMKCNVTINTDRCRLIRCYCSSYVWKVIQGLSEYRQDDWNALKARLRTLFDAERVNHIYTEKDLKDYVRKSRQKNMKNLRGFRKYQQNFTIIAGWLRNHNQIVQLQEQKYFWKGIPTKLKPRIKKELHTTFPAYRSSAVPTLAEIDQVAEEIFWLDRFDADDSDDDEDSGTLVDSSDSESPSSSKGEIEIKKFKSKKRKNGKRKSKITVKSKHLEDSSDEDSSESKIEKAPKSKLKIRFDTKKEVRKTKADSKDLSKRERELLNWQQTDEALKRLEQEGKAAAKHDEIDSLVKQMSDLTIRDEEFFKHYVNLITLAPNLKDVLQILVKKRDKINSMYTPPNNPTVLHLTTQPSTANWQGPSWPNNISNGQSQNSRPPMTQCFGCGDEGHMSRNCPRLLQFERSGEICNENGKWVLPSGGLPPRNRGESIADAVQRLIDNWPKAASVGLIRVGTPRSTIIRRVDDDTTDDKRWKFASYIGQVRDGQWTSDSKGEGPLVLTAGADRAMRAKTWEAHRHAVDKTSTAGQSKTKIQYRKSNTNAVEAQKPPKKTTRITEVTEAVDVEPAKTFDAEIDDIMEDEPERAASRAEDSEKVVVKQNRRSDTGEQFICLSLWRALQARSGLHHQYALIVDNQSKEGVLLQLYHYDVMTVGL